MEGSIRINTYSKAKGGFSYAKDIFTHRAWRQ